MDTAGSGCLYINNLYRDTDPLFNVASFRQSDLRPYECLSTACVSLTKADVWLLAEG